MDRRDAEPAGSRQSEGENNLADDLAHIVWIVATDGTAQYLNRYGRDFLGLDTDGAHAEAWLALVHPEDAVRVRKLWTETNHSGAPYEVEYRLRRADGEYRWLVERGVPQRDADGRVVRSVGTCTDIEEQKRAVASLLESEERYRRLSIERQRAAMELEQEKSLSDTLLASLPGMVYVVDRAGRLVRWNRAYEDVVGRSGAELAGADALLPLAPEDRAAIGGAMRSLFDRGGFDQAEGRVRTATGELRDYIFSGQRIEIDREPYVVGTGLDVTDRKRAEAALRQSEERFRSYFELGVVGMAVTSPAKGWLEVNARMCEMLGYARHELKHRTWADLTHPEDLAADVAQFERMLAGEIDGYSLPKRFVRKDGVPIDTILSVKCLRRPGEAGVDYVVAQVLDVTEQKRAEAEQARLSRVVEQTTESIVITDPSGTITYVNPAFERVTGYTRAEAVGTNPRILKSGHQDQAFYRRMWETLARGEVWKGRLVNRRKDGALFEEDATIGPVRDAAGRLVSYVAVKRDVTNETRLERQFLQAQKMEAVGRLAGGVAHDFNNLLGVIMGYAEITRRRLPEGDPLKERIDQILKAAERAAVLTRQLLAFSRQQVLQPKVLDLNAIVTDTEKMLRRLIGEDIELATVLAPGLGSVKADPGQLGQVIMNLAVNARDAMPDGGRLTIETLNTELDDDYVARHPLAKAGPYVLLSVSDTGAGMDAETQSRVFEPFFTTKELGRGTGLGLSTVYGIVKQSEGYIWLYSEVGIGTTFKVYLPRVDAAPAPAQGSRPAAPLVRGTETVLLIEDEPSLRDMLCETLEGGGYTVLVAANGAQAVRIADEYAGVIHLVVTDVIMPEMTGREAAQRIVGPRPETRVMYVSGYTDEAIAKHGVLSPGAVFLSKPFGPDELLRKVRELLDRPGPL